MIASWRDRVLVVAPHADDETLGCGGLLCSQLDEHQSRVLVLTIGKDAHANGNEQTVQELGLAMSRLGLSGSYSVAMSGMQSRLDTVPIEEIIRVIENEIRSFKPTALLFPYSSHHQDHRVCYNACLAAARPRAATDKVLLGLYEYPYVAAWPPPALPGGKFYLPISEEILSQKLLALSAYASQVDRDGAWLTAARVRSWAATRGEEIGERYAEAFWLIRGVLQ